MSKRVLIPAVLLVAAMVFAAGLYLFQPWRIFTSSTVTEDIPTATQTTTPSAGIIG